MVSNDPASLAEGKRRLAADPERARRMGREGAREGARLYLAARAERLAGLLRAI